MKRTTIFVPEALEHDLISYARREGKSAAAVVREAIEKYLAEHAAGVQLPSFVGIGDSERTDTAERHEELIFGGAIDRPPPRRRRIARTARRSTSRRKPRR